MKLSLFFIFIFFYSSLIFAQKPFIGTIIYDIKYEKSDFDDELKSAMPNELVVNYFGHLTKTKLTNNIGSSIIIANSDDKSTIILLEINKSKYAIINTKQIREKLMAERPETLIKFNDSLKSILGYDCKKAELYQGNFVLEAYYSEDLMTSNDTWQPQFKDIKAVLLEYTQVTENLKTRYIARSIIIEKFKKKDFEIPSDYKIITQEEFHEIMQSK